MVKSKQTSQFDGGLPELSGLPAMSPDALGHEPVQPAFWPPALHLHGMWLLRRKCVTFRLSIEELLGLLCLSLSALVFFSFFFPTAQWLRLRHICLKAPKQKDMASSWPSLGALPPGSRKEPNLLQVCVRFQRR